MNKTVSLARRSSGLTNSTFLRAYAHFSLERTSNQTNRFQSIDSLVEEFIDGRENENTKKKTKHDIALFHEFLVLKGKTRQIDS